GLRRVEEAVDRVGRALVEAARAGLEAAEPVVRGLGLCAIGEEAETADHPRLGCLEPSAGRFDERTADAVDSLFDAAEAANVDVVLTAFGAGFDPRGRSTRGWEDNPYNRARGGPAASPRAFFDSPAARAAAARRLRYIADRWASSPRLLAVDLLYEPERDGAIPERTWIPWAEAMSRAWRAVDPYGHLVTLGSVGLHWNVRGDERPWYASAASDLVQWQLYGKEVHDPHALADAMAHKVAESWTFDKPLFCGEFAYGREDPRTYDHTHVGIWALAMSGAGALARSAPPSAPDTDEPMTPERARHFRVLSDFLRSLDPRRAYSPRADVRVLAPAGARALSLTTAARDDRAVWILAPPEGYGERVTGATLAFASPRGGRWRVRWLDDTTGERLAAEDDHVTATDDDLVVLRAPPFTRHAAARITHE
ncbi:MAG TPA: hypothetical protein VM204_03405, partial [Gaiellaceae bacterium]|nr:hypothetical protein [Gaiellaceae bacterium]